MELIHLLKKLVSYICHIAFQGSGTENDQVQLKTINLIINEVPIW